MINTIFVTGGAGFIGSNFVHYWLKEYPTNRVVVLDALTYAGNVENLKPAEGNPNFRFVHADILDYDNTVKLLREEKIDTIVHFAAESHVDRSITSPDAFIETNVKGTHELLKAAKTVWLDENSSMSHLFQHISTDEVYGTLKPNDPPFREDTPYAPNSPYAASKASSDFFVRSYQETYGLNTNISNCSNNYGPYQFPEKLIPLVISNILESKALPIYGDGQQIRDWLYVDDHCKAIKKVFGEKMPKISSTKSLTGHSLGATGVQEAIYSILMMKNNFIAASANVENIDPDLNADEIATVRQDQVNIDTILSNSFGFGGTNATIAMSKYNG